MQKLIFHYTRSKYLIRKKFNKSFVSHSTILVFVYTSKYFNPCDRIYSYHLPHISDLVLYIKQTYDTYNSVCKTDISFTIWAEKCLEARLIIVKLTQRKKQVYGTQIRIWCFRANSRRFIFMWKQLHFKHIVLCCNRRRHNKDILHAK